MENENLVEPKKSSRSLVGFLLVIIIIGIVYIVFLNKKESAPTLEQEKSVLLKTSEFPYTKVSDFQVIEMSSLPEDLKVLVNPDVKNIFIQKGAGETGKLVYKIRFPVNQSLVDYYKQSLELLLDKSWVVSQATRSNTFAVMEANNTKYLLRFSDSVISETTTDVLIEVQTK